MSTTPTTAVLAKQDCRRRISRLYRVTLVVAFQDFCFWINHSWVTIYISILPILGNPSSVIRSHWFRGVMLTGIAKAFMSRTTDVFSYSGRQRRFIAMRVQSPLLQAPNEYMGPAAGTACTSYIAYDFLASFFFFYQHPNPQLTKHEMQRNKRSIYVRFRSPGRCPITTATRHLFLVFTLVWMRTH